VTAKAQPPQRAPARTEASKDASQVAVAAIVEATHQHVEVVASPGSGKTHTLILRLQALLSKGVPPAQILVLSFSNEAVREIRRRLELAAKNQATKTSVTSYSSITIQTVHAFANSQLKKSPTILPPKKQLNLLKKAIRTVQMKIRSKRIWHEVNASTLRRRREQIKALLDPLAIKNLATLMDYLSTSNATTKDALARSNFSSIKGAAVVKKIRVEFQRQKQQDNYIDFGDMLMLARQRISTGKVNLNIKHILVDEFQDCSVSQTAFIAQLAQFTNSQLMVFGDPLQSLYGFSGAGYQPLEVSLPGTVTMELPFSYRLHRSVADLACAVARPGCGNGISTIRSGPKPRLVKSRNSTSHHRAVVENIEHLLDSGVPPSAIAVLARTKALLAPIEAALLTKRLETNRQGNERQHQHVYNVLRLVQWMRNAQHSTSPISASRLKTLGSGSQFVDPEIAEREAKHLAKHALPTGLEGQYMLCSRVYLRLLGGIRADKATQAEVNRWTPVCRAHCDPKAMWKAIQSMDTDTVTTSTIHAAKGREWTHVLVVGVTDGFIPIYHAKDKDMVQEERNMLYVAITRAKETLTLFHAPTPHARSRQLFDQPSRFLMTRRVRKCLAP